MVGPWLLISVLVHSSFLGSTVFTAVDAARTSAFVVTTAPLPMAPAPSLTDSVLGDSKRKVPTGIHGGLWVSVALQKCRDPDLLFREDDGTLLSGYECLRSPLVAAHRHPKQSKDMLQLQ
ncbi:CLE family OsCLE302 protein [Zea mays]|uniref:CLE family OsCLE302 protein n=1 Tax=Zea mays TaxID=4577 RepID=A0A1D6JWU2_MAIZE|nr:CLE family OsCLE302 protein [Zea mays]